MFVDGMVDLHPAVILQDEPQVAGRHTGAVQGHGNAFAAGPPG